MKKFQVRRVTGLNSETSCTWFMFDEDIVDFMRDRYFKLEPTSDGSGLSFVLQSNMDAFLYIDEQASEYRLVLGFSDKEVTIDAGEVRSTPSPCDPEQSFRLSGRFLECKVVCAN